MKSNINIMSQDETDEPEHDINKIINLSDWSNNNTPSQANDDSNEIDPPENFFIIDDFLHDPNLRKSNWVRDDLVVSCEICNLEFSMFRRRHHCRCCGKIFCYQCTKYQIEVPDLDKGLSQKPAYKERVCSFCYKKIIDFKYLENLYIILSNLPLEIYDINNMAYVSRNWNRVSKYYRSNYKKILYKKFSETFTRNELNFVWINRRLFSGHSGWLIQVIRTIEIHYKDYPNISETDTDQILNILNLSRHTNCKVLKCSNNCKHILGTESAILCLSLPFRKLISEPYLMEVISHGTIEELLCYLPILVDIIKYRDEDNALCDYLIGISKKNYSFANFLFWEITVQMENKAYEPLYEKFRYRLTEEMLPAVKDYLKNSFYFVENLTEIVSEGDKFPTLIEAYFNTLHDNNIMKITSPVNPEITLSNVYKSGIRIRGSSSKPISIPFNIGDTHKSYELLYKKDDVRKDLVIMNIIKLIDIILKRDENLDLYITTYNILPTSNNTGFIEIVDNAETILGINKRKGFSILNFILEHNPDKSVDQVRERFTKSCVAYCILSYLLGIGDRHMENIMVKTSGEIFHIDFGFILGADPKPLAPEIRITDEMVDAMGGYESRHYAQFKELCARSFLCLRRHVSIFRCMFSTFTRANPPIDKHLTKEYIEKFINNKFLVGENVGNAKLYLINKVSTRSMGYSESLIDFCHQAQDSTTVINSTLTSSAMNLGNTILGMFWKNN